MNIFSRLQRGEGLALLTLERCGDGDNCEVVSTRGARKNASKITALQSKCNNAAGIYECLEVLQEVNRELYYAHDYSDRQKLRAMKDYLEKRT